MENASKKPGRDLDVLVAEKVMGWTEIETVKQGHTGLMVPQGIRPGERASSTGYRPKFVIPNYSTDIAAAWEIQRIFEDPMRDGTGYVAELLAVTRGEESDRTIDLDDAYRIAFATPAQRCLAALAAKGTQID